MKIAQVIQRLESYAPTALAEDFDNVGLLVGNENTELTAALLTLDVDIDVAQEAAENGANLIVSHHPVIFNPLRRITAETAQGRCLLFLIENGISVYSAHTNLDSAQGGLNDLIAALLKLEHLEPMLKINENCGLGRVGILPSPMSMDELSHFLMQLYHVPHIRYTGNADDKVSRVAICSGGGGSMVNDAVNSLADVYISGDIKYNDARDAVAAGMNIIDVTHYDSEILAPRLFARILGEDVKTFITQTNKNVFTSICK